MPAFIVWELWNMRNHVSHGGTASLRHLQHEVSFNLFKLALTRFPVMQGVPSIWPELVHFAENFTAKFKYIKVQWSCPSLGWLKCNTDGACRGNPGASSIGYCIRNHEGDLVYTKAKKIGEGSNVQAEAQAIYDAMRYCVDASLVPAIIETDSLFLKNIIEGVWKTYWVIAPIIDEIMILKQRGCFAFAHVLREGNRLADHLANVAFDVGMKEFHTFHDLSSEGKQY